MTDPDLLFTAKIRNLTENELVVFFVCSVFYQIIFRANMMAQFENLGELVKMAIFDA